MGIVQILSDKDEHVKYSPSKQQKGEKPLYNTWKSPDFYWLLRTRTTIHPIGSLVYDMKISSLVYDMKIIALFSLLRHNESKKELSSCITPSFVGTSRILHTDDCHLLLVFSVLPWAHLTLGAKSHSTWIWFAITDLPFECVNYLSPVS